MTAVTEFRQRPLTVVSVLSFLGMFPNRDEVRDSFCWWRRHLTVSIPGSCYSFAARKVRGWFEPPARPSLTPQGMSTVYIRSHNSLFSQVTFQWRTIRPATLVSLHSLGHTRRSMCAVGSRRYVLVSCYKSKIE